MVTSNERETMNGRKIIYAIEDAAKTAPNGLHGTGISPHLVEVYVELEDGEKRLITEIHNGSRSFVNEYGYTITRRTLTLYAGVPVNEED